MTLTFPETQADHLPKQTIDAYLESLASSSPTPGGGAAAGLSLAQGCALYSMALRVSFNKESHQLPNPLHPESVASTSLEEVLNHLTLNRNQFLSAAEEDTKVFTAVMAAYRLPRSTDPEKKARHEAIERALTAALILSKDMIQLAYETSTWGSYAVYHAKPSILSDSGIATELMLAGSEACYYNALINMKSLSSPPESLGTEIRNLRHQIQSLYSTFKGHCIKSLGG